MKSQSSSSHRRDFRRTLLLLVPLVLFLIADYLVAPHYRIAYNETTSLPGTLFLVKTGQLPKCGANVGEHVQFQMAGDARWFAGEKLLKIAKGCPGDTIDVVDGSVYINGWHAGEAVPALQDGTRLESVKAGVIPPGHFYMWASHPASFDSRYAEFALVPASQVIGAAKRIF